MPVACYNLDHLGVVRIGAEVKQVFWSERLLLKVKPSWPLKKIT